MKKKNKTSVNIALDTKTILSKFKTFVLKIITTSLSITKYVLITWVVFVLTTNAIQFIETTMIIFDEFLVKEWATYKIYGFVEETLGLGLNETWIPVEEACSVIVGVN